jgi:uncharacterized protein YbjT (DUF2867 family)
MDPSGKTILVTGATGRQGAVVAHHLMAEGWRVRATTRRPEASEARALQAQGIELVDADMTVRSTLDPVLRDVYGVFAMATPFQISIASELDQGKTLGEAAATAGVQHYVYSSVGGADRRTGVPHFDSKWEIEEHLRGLGLPLSVVRPVFFMENFISYAMQRTDAGLAVTSGLAPTTRLQLVAVDDIGGVVAQLFKEPGRFIGAAMELAGDEQTMPDVARQMTTVLGEPVEYVRQPLETVRQYSEDTARLYEWFERAGYEADIAACRRLYPPLHDLGSWLTEVDPAALRRAA